VAIRRASAATAAGIALTLFSAGLTASLAWSVARSARRIEMSFVHAGESPLAERSREFGAPYARRIEEIRRAIPPDGAYALVDGDGAELGGAVWVRFDLEPRRAILLGLRKDLPGAAELRRRIPPEARWVVVAYAEGPPQRMTIEQLLADRP